MKPKKNNNRSFEFKLEHSMFQGLGECSWKRVRGSTELPIKCFLAFVLKLPVGVRGLLFWELMVFDAWALPFLNVVCLVREAHLAGGKEHCITEFILDGKLKEG